MSFRHKKQRRLRYYRNNYPLLKNWARILDYWPCDFTDVGCDLCLPTLNTKRRAIFCHRSGGEEPESSFVCAHCMPEFYRGQMAEWFFYGTRKFDRMFREQERQMQEHRLEQRRLGLRHHFGIL